MRRIFIFFTALLTALTLAACSGSDDSPSPEGDSTEKNSPGEVEKEADPLTLKIMSFNILEGVKSGEKEGFEWNTSGRKENVLKMIEAESPDIICLQECRRAQLNDLKSAFSEYTYLSYAKDGVLASGYSKGSATDDACFKNGGQRNVIMLRKNILSSESWGVFWLSETPDEVSKGFGTDGQKITLWSKVKIKATGKNFYVFCTHFIPQSYGNKVDPVVDVLTPCAELNAARIKEIIGDKTTSGKSKAEDTLFFMGDLNCEDGSEMLSAISSYLEYARTKAKDSDDRGTYTSSGKRIDHIYYLNAEPLKFRVIDDSPYGLLSDHHPIWCEFQVK